MVFFCSNQLAKAQLQLYHKLRPNSRCVLCLQRPLYPLWAFPKTSSHAACSMRFPSEWSRTREIRRARHRMSLSKSCVLFIALMETASRRSELDRTGAEVGHRRSVELSASCRASSPKSCVSFTIPGENTHESTMGQLNRTGAV